MVSANQTILESWGRSVPTENSILSLTTNKDSSITIFPLRTSGGVFCYFKGVEKVRLVTP